MFAPNPCWVDIRDNIASAESTLCLLVNTTMIHHDFLPPQYRLILGTLPFVNTIVKTTSVAVPLLPTDCVAANDMRGATICLVELLRSFIGNTPAGEHLQALLNEPTYFCMHAALGIVYGHPSRRINNQHDQAAGRNSPGAMAPPPSQQRGGLGCFFTILIAGTEAGSNVGRAIKDALASSSTDEIQGLCGAHHRPTPILPFPDSPAKQTAAAIATSEHTSRHLSFVVHHVNPAAVNTIKKRSALCSSLNQCRGINIRLLYGQNNPAITLSVSHSSKLATVSSADLAAACYSTHPPLEPSPAQVAAGNNLLKIPGKGRTIRRLVKAGRSPPSATANSTPNDSPARGHRGGRGRGRPPAQGSPSSEGKGTSRRNRRPHRTPFRSGYQGKVGIWYIVWNGRRGRQAICVTQDYTEVQFLTCGLSCNGHKKADPGRDPYEELSSLLPPNISVTSDDNIRAIQTPTPTTETNLTNPYNTGTCRHNGGLALTFTAQDDSELRSLCDLATLPSPSVHTIAAANCPLSSDDSSPAHTIQTALSGITDRPTSLHPDR